MSVFEKMLSWLRPYDLREAIAACGRGLEAEGFAEQAGDLHGLLDLGGDRYETREAIGSTVKGVLHGVKDRASPGLVEKLRRLAAEFPEAKPFVPTEEQRLGGLRDALFRVDRPLREAGFAETAGMAFQLAKCVEAGGELEAARLREAKAAFEKALGDRGLPDELRRDLEALVRRVRDFERLDR